MKIEERFQRIKLVFVLEFLSYLRIISIAWYNFVDVWYKYIITGLIKNKSNGNKLYCLKNEFYFFPNETFIDDVTIRV